MVFKSLNGLAPECLSSTFIARSNTTFRDSVNKLTIPQTRTDYLRNSLRYSGAVLGNSLPETLRQAESLSNFKSLCTVIIISRKALACENILFSSLFAARDVSRGNSAREIQY